MVACRHPLFSPCEIQTLGTTFTFREASLRALKPDPGHCPLVGGRVEQLSKPGQTAYNARAPYRKRPCSRLGKNARAFFSYVLGRVTDRGARRNSLSMCSQGTCEWLRFYVIFTLGIILQALPPLAPEESAVSFTQY